MLKRLYPGERVRDFIKLSSLEKEKLSKKYVKYDKCKYRKKSFSVEENR